MKKISKLIVATLLATQLVLALPVNAFANESIEETEQGDGANEKERIETKQELANVTDVENSNEDQEIVSEPSIDQESNNLEQEYIIEEFLEAPIVHEQAIILIDKNEATQEFISKNGEQARKVAEENDLYASVMLAQAILESDSGESELSSAPFFNLFGIKGSYEGQSVSFYTNEDNGSGELYQTQEAFRQYPSYKESFEDYAALLKGKEMAFNEFYSGTWKSNTISYQEATQALTGTYATDTLYDQKLNALIAAYDLTQYDQEGKPTFYAGGEFEPYNNINYDIGNSYASGNCTQYVYNRITQLGGTIGLTMGNGMDWASTGIAQGYEVASVPKAGTAVSFQPGVAGADGTYGHVAFVEQVKEDGSIEISEMNVLGAGIVSLRTIDSVTASQLNYITPK